MELNTGAFREIADISGMEYLVNLTELILFGNQISDLSPLVDLTNLIELQLGQNLISDISPLLQLTNLKALGLAGNNLDLSRGSQALNIIRQLERRGVELDHLY